MFGVKQNKSNLNIIHATGKCFSRKRLEPYHGVTEGSLKNRLMKDKETNYWLADISSNTYNPPRFIFSSMLAWISAHKRSGNLLNFPWKVRLQRSTMENMHNGLRRVNLQRQQTICQHSSASFLFHFFIKYSMRNYTYIDILNPWEIKMLNTGMYWKLMAIKHMSKINEYERRNYFENVWVMYVVTNITHDLWH